MRRAFETTDETPFEPLIYTDDDEDGSYDAALATASHGVAKEIEEEEEEDEEEEEVEADSPMRFQRCTTITGQVYYVDHHLKITTWEL